MISLNTDPDTIPFMKGHNISLPLLKNQIDRRILKITCLINNLTHPKMRRSKSHCSRQIYKQNKASQTLEAQFSQQQTIIDSQILAPSKNICNNQQEKQLNSFKNTNQKIKSKIKKQGASKHPSSKKQIMKRGETKCYEKQNLQDHLLPLIQSNGFTFREVKRDISEGSSDRRRDFMASQDDKIFESVDFGLTISNVQMCKSISAEEDQQIKSKTAVHNRDNSRNDYLMVSTFTDLSGSQITKTQNSNRTILTRKIKIGGKNITLPLPERRVVVGQDCKTKMLNDVQQLIGRKRKQAWDNKLRMNVLKKIQQKYSQEYIA